jgi:hypothetical protein
VSERERREKNAFRLFFALHPNDDAEKPKIMMLLFESLAVVQLRSSIGKKKLYVAQRDRKFG